MLNDTAIDGWATLGAEAANVIFTDPLTGRRAKARSRRTDAGTQVYLQLQPGQSLLIETAEQVDDTLPDWAYYAPAGTPVEGTDWHIDFPQSLPKVEQRFAIGEPHSWTVLQPIDDLPDKAARIADDETLPQLANRNGRTPETERALADLTRLCGTGRYTGTFRVESPATAEAWRLQLGTVYESARVRVNGRDAGTAWSVPFELDVTPLLVAGDNRIEIEVTNLPANLIADFDRRGVEWRIFKDANVVSSKDGRLLKTDGWQLEPAGLAGPVVLQPLRRLEPATETTEYENENK
ncbi:MAG: hypothetical protein K2K43_03850 [Alistipes sp.]|nr:hypothetical protein [Alistipes sp.]